MSSPRTASNRPRNAVGGLPPGPRSRSVGRDRERDRDAYPAARPPLPTSAAPARQVRPQRSLANIPAHAQTKLLSASPSSRPPLPPAQRDYDRTPRARNDYPAPRARNGNDYAARRSDASSLSSASTSASDTSSFLGRMKVRSNTSSARTSWEEEREAPRGRDKGWARERAPERRVATPENYAEEDEDEEPVTPGHGSSLWTRVAAAANTMTINVSKAWASNITTFAGEETPPGQESRLTRAMKAYHLDKARDPSDLPEWLFEEHERGVRRPSTTARRASEDNRADHDTQERGRAPAPRSRGLKDVYAAAAAPNSYTQSEPARSRSRVRQTNVDETPGPSKANDRLKALRDAKRGAAQRNAYTPSERGADVQEERGRGGGASRAAPVPETRRAPPRMGLPTRPGPQQRF